MRLCWSCMIGLLVLCICTINVEVEAKLKPTIQKKDEIEKDTFKLTYTFIGMGSNCGQLQPLFKVKEIDYHYTREQNCSLFGKFDKKPEFVCSGKLRTTSIDSIINLVNQLSDTLIYKANTHITSGGIYSISIHHNNKNIEFNLHNASDETAKQIVDILNANIPAAKQKLVLFNP